MSTENDPRSKPTRTLVLCFDGTSGEYDSDNTNVVKFISLLKKDDPNEQLTYYQPGVGTWFNPGIVSPVFEWAAKVLDLAFAWYLDAHVLDGYRFLMQNYAAGDKICLFGFSRGAYTARALAGFLHKVGLLPRDNHEQIPFAYKLYKCKDPEGVSLAAGFKQTFCHSVPIEFMGVWDTVASVGVIMCRTLPFTNSNSSIRVFRHALSLDERRARYKPRSYYPSMPLVIPSAQESQRGYVNIFFTKRKNSSSSSNSETTKKRISLPRGLQAARHWSTRNSKRGLTESDDVSADVREVWFAGAHGDIGGGDVPKSEPYGLSNVSLRWMVRQAMAAQCGIQFDMDALRRGSIPIQTFPPSATESSPEEAELNQSDALQPIHDQLKLNGLWWVLENTPLYHTWQDRNGILRSRYSINLGRGRKIRDPHPKFHTTVRQRIDAEDLRYFPRARWVVGSEVYVE